MWLILSKMWGCCLCKHSGNQRGSYLVIWAVQSRPRGEGKNVFLVRGSGWAGGLLGLRETQGAQASQNSPQGQGQGRGRVRAADLGSWVALSLLCPLSAMSLTSFPQGDERGGPWLPACGLCHSWGPDRPGGWALANGPGKIRPLAVQDSPAVECQGLSGTLETGY